MTKKDKNKDIVNVTQKTTQEVSNNSIIIRHTPRTGQHKHYYRQKINQGEFLLPLSLPSDVDNEQAKTSFKDGIADITLAKFEKSKRTILEIK